MVKRQKRDSTETPANKEENEQQLEARKISASTLYETCSEPLSAFGGVLALIKFLDLIQFEQLFEHCYTKPARETRLGHYRMVVGIVMLLFIGFNRIGHFGYLRFDALLCRFFQGSVLAGGEHVLALCGQSGNQSGAITDNGNECHAGAGMAAVRAALSADSY